MPPCINLKEQMKKSKRFENWTQPKINNNQLTKYNWLVQNSDGLKLGMKTDIGAFTYINARVNLLV